VKLEVDEIRYFSSQIDAVKRTTMHPLVLTTERRLSIHKSISLRKMQEVVEIIVLQLQYKLITRC
jgi:hypothetical protein